MKIIFLLFSIMILSTEYSYSQSKLFHIKREDSHIFINGDSSLHEWKMEVNNFEAKGYFSLPHNSNMDFKSLLLKIKVNTIKSDNESMDDKAYILMKSKEEPYITFKLKRLEFLSNNLVISEGDLSIAGKTNPVAIEHQLILDHGQIKAKGTHTLKMSSFGIKPPKILFIKTKDKVTIDFNLVLIPEEDQ